jgi:hypothetical protein
MQRHRLWLTALMLFTLMAPGTVGKDHPDEGKATGEHNFDQWQTIKRLEIRK